MSRFLTLEEVAEEARASVSTVRHWLRTGRLASVKLGKRRLVPSESLEALIAAGSNGGSFVPGKRSLHINGYHVTAWQYRSWLLYHPRPTTVRVHYGSDDTKPQEIRIGKRPLARIGETIEALQPDLVEALDARGQLLRAMQPEIVLLQRTLEAKAEELEATEAKTGPGPRKRARRALAKKV